MKEHDAPRANAKQATGKDGGTFGGHKGGASGEAQGRRIPRTSAGHATEVVGLSTESPWRRRGIYRLPKSVGQLESEDGAVEACGPLEMWEELGEDTNETIAHQLDGCIEIRERQRFGEILGGLREGSENREGQRDGFSQVKDQLIVSLRERGGIHAITGKERASRRRSAKETSSTCWHRSRKSWLRPRCTLLRRCRKSLKSLSNPVRPKGVTLRKHDPYQS